MSARSGATLGVGGSLGRYAILGRLGAGGMGEVYRARDPSLEREVALKLLPPGTADPENLARFEREAKALAALNHRNIVGIYSVEEADGLHFLTMELVEGQSLRDAIPRPGLPLDRFFAFALPLAEAVAAAHERGILHRDLKPANVMVDREGRLKVLDFGLARRGPVRDPGLRDPEEATETVTVAGPLVGTAPYLSPEQIQGRPADARSDLFSLGVILYEMLTGGRPFAGPSTAALLASVLHEAPPPVTELRPDLPRHLGRVVGRCLEKDPRDRYQTARDLVNELRGLRQELATGPREVAGPAPPRPRRRRRAWAVAAAAALLAALAVALPFVLREAPRPAAGPSVVAVLPLTNASGDPANDHLGLGFADSLITRLAGVPALAVVSRAAIGEYAGGAVDRDEAARRLGADYLVVGSHQREGQRLLVNVSLVEAKGSVVRGTWQEEVDAADLFALQRRLALGVAEGLALTLSRAERERLEASPSRDPEAWAQYSRARGLLQRSDVADNVDRAVALLVRAVGRDDSFALAHTALGDAYWARYQATLDPRWAERATAAIHRAAALAPDDPQVRLSLARVYEGTGRRAEALAQLEAALDRRPNSDDAWREYGKLLADEGRREEAQAALERAIRIRPGYWENHYRLGGLHLRGGRFAEATAAYERALALTPDNVRVLQNLGATAQMAGDEARAIESYERALAIDPTSDGALTNLGLLLYQAHRYDEAAAAIERAVALVPRDPLLHRNLGDAYRRAGEEERAQQAYGRGIAAAEELLRTNPEDVATLALQAVCEAKLARHEDAVRHIGAAVARGPGDATVRFRAAVVHALAGRSAEAAGEIAQALALGIGAQTVRDDDDLAAVRDLPSVAELLREAS
jgi:serine/threonine-protein kinase